MEGNEANNDLILDNVKVVSIGDINGDGLVNIVDAVVIAHAWDATPSDGHWNVKADLNHDGVIDVFDATKLSLNWG